MHLNACGHPMMHLLPANLTSLISEFKLIGREANRSSDTYRQIDKLYAQIRRCHRAHLQGHKTNQWTKEK